MTETPCACNLHALSPAERHDHHALVARLHTRLLSTEEHPDGVTLRLPSDEASLTEVMRFVLLERRCCPFLSFTLDLAPGEPLTLTLRGEGTAREVIRSELGW